MNKGIIIYSRMGSTRLPGKALRTISEYQLLEHIVLRVKFVTEEVKNLNIIIATTNSEEDDVIMEIANKLNVKCYRGHPTDLVDRTVDIVNENNLKAFCRVNGDCPFVDVNLIRKGLDIFESWNYVLVTNIFKRTYPYGVAVEWVDAKKYLEYEEKVKDEEREHVTMHLYKLLSGDKIYNIENDLDLSHLKLAVDTPEDLERIREYFKNKKINSLKLNFNQIK